MQVGTTVTRAGMDVAGVTCVGLTLLAVFLPRPETLPGAALRTREQVRARAGSGCWSRWPADGSCWSLLGIAFRAADAFGRAVDELGGRRAAGLDAPSWPPAAACC